MHIRTFIRLFLVSFFYMNTKFRLFFFIHNLSQSTFYRCCGYFFLQFSSFLFLIYYLSKRFGAVVIHYRST